MQISKNTYWGNVFQIALSPTWVLQMRAKKHQVERWILCVGKPVWCNLLVARCSWSVQLITDCLGGTPWTTRSKNSRSSLWNCGRPDRSPPAPVGSGEWAQRPRRPEEAFSECCLKLSNVRRGAFRRLTQGRYYQIYILSSSELIFCFGFHCLETCAWLFWNVCSMSADFLRILDHVAILASTLS